MEETYLKESVDDKDKTEWKNPKEEPREKQEQKDESLYSAEVLAQPAIEVFPTDLLNLWSDYIGKKVTVSYACGRCDDYDKSIESVYDDDARLYLRSYADNNRQFQYEEYITVTGIVDSQYASYIDIKNAHIDYFGNESQSAYDIGKAAYDEKKRADAAEQEASFKSNVEAPSYDV